MEMINATRKRTNKPKSPHSGAVTHHQLQSMVCVSFRIKNAINNTPAKDRTLYASVCLLSSMICAILRFRAPLSTGRNQYGIRSPYFHARYAV